MASDLVLTLDKVKAAQEQLKAEMKKATKLLERVVIDGLPGAPTGEPLRLARLALSMMLEAGWHLA